MDNAPAPFSNPAWRPYLKMVGNQAQRLMDDTTVPAELEALLEKQLRQSEVLTAEVIRVTYGFGELENRRTAGTWTDVDTVRRDQLRARLAELRTQYSAMLDELAAVARHHSAPPSP